ncbi:unnamed protein product [Tilletia caries]|nr:unnamed protein product [Tilletia caries]
MQSHHKDSNASRTDRNESRDMTAAQRFFNIPELVSLLCTCCTTERIDLITLASVSKFLRAVALPHWVRYLDLALSSADKKLNFFVENPSLLSHIRYLRIRDEYYSENRNFDGESPVLVSSKTKRYLRPRWHEVNQLLAMIVAQSSTLLRLPSIDITIDVAESIHLETAFRPFPRLNNCVVALRIFINEAFEVWGSESLLNYRKCCHQEWASIGRFIQRTCAPTRSSPQPSHNSDDSGPGGQALGLRLFHLVERTTRRYQRGSRPAAPLDFWEELSAATASSLRDLSLTFFELENLANIFPLLAHSHLSHLVLKIKPPIRSHVLVSCVETFLDQNQSTLEDIHLETERTMAFCRGQRSTPIDLRTKFAQRHPQLKGLHTPAKGDFPVDVFPALRVLNATSRLKNKLEQYALEGGRLSHVEAAYPFDLQDLSTSSWLSRNPDPAKAITCLDLFYVYDRLDELRPHFHSAFSSDFLPNLTELAVGYKDKDIAVSSSYVKRLFDHPQSERDLARVLVDLCSAKSLRVLHLHSSEAAPFKNTGDLLASMPNARFPPSFEYFTWFVKAFNKTHYYRFVPSEERSSSPDGSKRGRLQPISSFFRTRITKEGVWNRAFDDDRRRILYDHTPLDGPVMHLS